MTDLDKISNDLYGLLVLGALDKEVEWGGHAFRIRTLKVGEELAVTLIIKDYTETVGQMKAYATATVAAALEQVDGRPLIAPLGPDIRASVRQRYEYIRDNWYWPTIEFLYTEYLELLQRQIKAMEELEGKSEGSLPTSTDLVDSLTDKEFYEAL